MSPEVTGVATAGPPGVRAGEKLARGHQRTSPRGIAVLFDLVDAAPGSRQARLNLDDVPLQSLFDGYSRRMVAEGTQELGRTGVATVKRWLEATTFIELPFDVYNHTLDCTIAHIGGVKRFDLQGYYLTGNKGPIFVESKRYSTPGGQYKEFLRFLAIAYSSTVKEDKELGGHKERHFLWVTFHPFNLENWSVFESHEHMCLALSKNPELLGGEEIDQNLVREVSSRIMVLLFNPKQEAISLTRQELKAVRLHIDRKANSL